MSRRTELVEARDLCARLNLEAQTKAHKLHILLMRGSQHPVIAEQFRRYQKLEDCLGRFWDDLEAALEVA